jgi:Putative Flp pilus-assembly TadE/G-like
MIRQADGRTTESHGQVLVITAAAMVVLLLIAAIVIDLGFSWMLHRQEQNAADPAALAAARFISEPDPVSGVQTFDAAQGTAAACAYAVSNGIFDPFNTTCNTALDPDHAILEVHWPPLPSAGGKVVGDHGYVQVVVSKRHDSFFGRILGHTFETVSTQAVAARKKGPADTATLRVEDPTGCSSMKVHGTSFVHIYAAPGVTAPGGFVYVESNCGTQTSDDACSNGTGALKIDGTTAALWAPKTNVVGSCQSTSDEPHGILDEASSPLGDPLNGLRFPAVSPVGPGQTCGQGGTATQPTGSASKGCGAGGGPNWTFSPDASCPGLTSGYKCVVLSPGVYYGGWSIGSKLRVTLQPGIYVIAGGGINIGATGSLDSLNGGSSPAPVLIFNTDNPAWSNCPASNDPHCQQDLDITAGGALALRGLLPNAACPPVTSPTATGCPFGNMVFWYDQFGSQSAGHTGDLIIEGGTEMYLAGTIYAPTANVTITGNSTTNTNGDQCPGVDGTQPLPGKSIAAVQVIAWSVDLGGTGDLCMPYDPSQLWHLNQQGLVQ